MAKDRTDAPRPDATNIDALPQSQRDFIDLNNEHAGRETGRAKRFLTSQDELRLGADKKNKSLSALLRLLDDPVYAGAYYTLQNLTERIDDAIDVALVTNAERISEAKQKLQRLKDTAAELPELLKAREELLALSTERRDIEQYRYGILADTKDWLTDEDNPRSLEELEQRTKELNESMPKSLRSALDSAESAAPAADEPPVANSAADDFLNDAALNAPDLTGTFKTAHDHASATSPVRNASSDRAPGAKR